MTRAALPEASLSTILAFVRTCEEGSFTAAAKRLHVTPAAVSRSVARLEAQLGVRLFRRTTRQLRSTPEGERYRARCVEALAGLAEAEAELRGREGPPRGRVRLSLPTTLGLHHVVAGLAGFTDAHPEIALDVQIGNHTVDFVREGFDLAVRLGRIEDASLVARKLGDAPLGVFASPDYLARHGRPRSLEALADHEQLAFVLPRSGRVLPWLFASPSVEREPRGRVRCLDDPQGLVALAEAGLGLCQIYRFMVTRSLAEGRLVEVLERHADRTRPFSLVYPKAPLAPHVRAVVDWIVRRKLR
ncbi:MAG: LysR family transcriptional regulator [Sandaracinaceae bacterium]|nr:LysR family transcriptional regulator [Sandaracinaceae bacterium]